MKRANDNPSGDDLERPGGSPSGQDMERANESPCGDDSERSEATAEEQTLHKTQDDPDNPPITPECWERVKGKAKRMNMVGEDTMDMAGEDAAGKDAVEKDAAVEGAAGEDAAGAGEDAAGEGAAIPLEVSELVGRKRWSLARAWREHKGLTREEVAGRMGISPAAVAQMEASSAKPRMATLRKIAEALGIEAEQLRP